MAGLKKNIILHFIVYRFLYHSPVYKRYRKCSDCDVNDYSSDMFNNICFLWNQEWL